MFETPPFPADAPRFGDGRFVVVSRIGQGRSGAVYRGYDLAHGEWRAFKLLNVELATDWEAWDRFVRDGLLLARTAHPNLVRVHEVVGGRAPFLVMDLVTGGTLQRWTDRHGAMPPRMACTATMEVARGVAAIHASGGVHGAIGPANVLVTHHGVRQLSDLSAHHDPDERTVDVAALGDLLRRLCGSDLPPKLAVIASGCGVGSLQIAADVAEALERVRTGLPDDPASAPEPMLTTTGGERVIRVAALPPDLARLVAEAPGLASLEPTQPQRPGGPLGAEADTTDTVRFGAPGFRPGAPPPGFSGGPNPRPSQDVTEPLDDTFGWNAAHTSPAAIAPPDSRRGAPPPESRRGAPPPRPDPDEAADPDSVTVPTLPGRQVEFDPPETTGPTTPLGPARLARGRIVSPEPAIAPARSVPDPARSPMPVSAGARRVAAPQATAEQPRPVFEASGLDELSNPDLEITDRAEPLDWDSASSLDPRDIRPTRKAPPPRAPSPAGPPQSVAQTTALSTLTPEPPPVPPHLLRGAVAPLLVGEPDPVLAVPEAPVDAAAASRWNGCLSMVMVPASAAFGLSLALLAVAILAIATAARDVAGTAAATESTRVALHQALQQHAVVIDRLPVRNEDRAALEAAFSRYTDTTTEPEHTEAALKLLDEVDRVATMHEDGAELTYRVRQMRSARADHVRAVEAWDVTAGSLRGRLVVSLGLATGPPER